MNKLAYSVVETAAILNVAPSTLRGAIRRGELPHVRIGARIIISAATIRRLLDPGMVQAPEASP